MKRLILLFIVTALMPVCNSMYAQLQGTYIGVSPTGDTGDIPLLYENYISLKDCSNTVAISLSYPIGTEYTWYAFTPNFNTSLYWYGPSSRDPNTGLYGPSNMSVMYFIPQIEHGWVSFNVRAKTPDGNIIQTSFKFVIRP